MARPKKDKAASEKAPDSSLLSALKFIGLVTKEIGTPSETHVRLQSNWATASNGILALGHPIKEDLFACPQNKLLIDALSKCTNDIEFKYDTNLSIKSGKLKAIIPCLAPDLINCIGPDEPIATIDNRLKEGFEAVGMSTIENNSQTIYNASILLNGQSIVGTDGKVLIEYWHGIDLPKGLPIPKNVITPLLKSNKILAQFGMSKTSVTFWYSDGAWIKSQLYAEEWPDVGTILDRPSQQSAVPKGFFDGLDAIKGFTDTSVYFGPGIVRSHSDDAVGASYEVPGLPAGPIFNLKQLLMLKSHIETVDFQVAGPFTGNMLLWHGKNCRGAVSGITQ